MTNIAVILTVYNRRETTLKGLASLDAAIKYLGDGYHFDIYMTDDGCTDGTSEAVVKEFPDVHIIQGDGKLYWSGGMRKAWQAAIDNGKEYDFYLWFNDDAELYDDALVTIFKSYNDAGGNAIISGAFCDKEGKAAYGGKRMNRTVIPPNGKNQEIKLMNGNLVLIPYTVYEILRTIDIHYKHGFGDYDYGLRAQKAGMKVFLSSKYVGSTDRHDEIVPPYFSKQNSLTKRWSIMHDPRNTPSIAFRFNLRYMGIMRALLGFARNYIYMMFPSLFYLKKHID